MPSLAQKSEVDQILLREFELNLLSKVPRSEKGKIVNATPVKDLTEVLTECAKSEYHLGLSGKNFRIFGKFESTILSGSVKVRPAIHIIHDAIASGNLRRDQKIFEATSGNFGIALGLMDDLGVDVIALVSRKLQEGVFEELRSGRIKTLDLDIDICPAPGIKVDASLLAAKGVAANIRSQLLQFGLDPRVFDNSRREIEELLARQDAINLAKHLAKIYGGFCPEQYDNELNVKAHETVTAPEIDAQLQSLGHELADFKIICTFGTGGTSGGLSRYLQRNYGKRSVHVVFPLAEQDVAGIRTKDKALGLRFYEPERYAGEHEVDFEQAKRLLKFFVRWGYDIGESSALGLYAVLQMVNLGIEGNFLVILADGIGKYKASLESRGEDVPLEIGLEDASSRIGSYSEVLWTHAMFTPRADGIRLIADSLGCEESKIRVIKARDVQRFLATQEFQALGPDLREGEGNTLLVCMVGGTSLRVAQLLAQKGVHAQSLTGGITGLSAARGIQQSKLVQVAIE